MLQWGEHEDSINFYCYTDDIYNLRDNIHVIPLEDLGLDGVWNKLALFKPGILPEGKWLYLDLDVIVQNRLTKFYELKTFFEINIQVVNSTCFFAVYQTFLYLISIFYIYKINC